MHAANARGFAHDRPGSDRLKSAKKLGRGLRRATGSRPDGAHLMRGVIGPKSAAPSAAPIFYCYCPMRDVSDRNATGAILCPLPYPV